MNYVSVQNNDSNTPLLYSYRRCPYAMRARMALIDSRINFDLYEISLKNKPHEMLSISPKGTVPVLKVGNKVIDESINIMIWAYENGNSSHYANHNADLIKIGLNLIKTNDNEFKLCLDQYKYAINHPMKTKGELRTACLFFIEILEERLKQQRYLLSDKVSFADIAIAPFIRQFANVDLEYFSSLKFIRVQIWLLAFTRSKLFINAMIKPT
ncbi:MAG: glutathione S-transferase [Methylophilales bacterium]|nr:glutathione S-transferase [Methylophilales bacterium]